MTGIKKTITTEEMIISVRLDVDAILKLYNLGNDTWKVYARKANYTIRALNLFGIKKSADFSDTWDEIMEVTNFRKLYTIKEVAEFIKNGCV